jgi:hypothetical protein
MDLELRQYLEGMEGRFDARIDSLQVRMDVRIDSLEERMNAKIETVETNLLTAFHGWARPKEIRVRNSVTIVDGFEERLTLVEERLRKLEEKKAS